MRDYREERPIVIIEDSDEDYEVTVWALKQVGVSNPVYRCNNAAGIAVLLTGRPDWPAALSGPFPLLVFLDLNIPGTTWHETLRGLRTNFWWQQVPVLILSTSSQPDIVAGCYAAGAAGYLKKPIDLGDFVTLMRHVCDYWLRAVVPPIPAAQAPLDLFSTKT